MKYYKSFGGALSSAFDKSNELDDKKKKIKSSEKGLSSEEYYNWKKEQLKRKYHYIG